MPDSLMLGHNDFGSNKQSNATLTTPITPWELKDPTLWGLANSDTLSPPPY